MADIFKLVGTVVIEAETAKKTLDDVTTKAKSVNTELENVDDKASVAGNGLDTASAHFGEKGKFGMAAVWLGNLLADLTKKAVNLGYQLINSGIDYNATMERYQKSFATMLGSEEEAQKMMEDLKKFALNTPFDVQGIAQATQQLLSYGVAAEDVLEVAQMLGDMSQGSTDYFSRAAVAYAQMMGKGKLAAQEANQFINAGVPIYKLLQEYTQKSQGDIMKMMEGGELTADVVLGALRMATSEGGRYYNAMSNMTTTYTGQMQKLEEQADITSGALTENLFNALKEDGISSITNMLEKLNRLLETNPDFLSGVGDVITSIANAGESFMNWLAGDNQGIYGIVSEMNVLISTYKQTVKEGTVAYAEAVGWINTLVRLEGKTSLTAQEQSTWNLALERLKEILPGASDLIDEQTGKINGGTQALKDHAAATLADIKAQAQRKLMEDATAALVNAEAAKIKANVEMGVNLDAAIELLRANLPEFDENATAMYEGLKQQNKPSDYRSFLYDLLLNPQKYNEQYMYTSADYYEREKLAGYAYDIIRKKGGGEAYGYIETARDTRDGLPKLSQDIEDAQKMYDAYFAYIQEHTETAQDASAPGQPSAASTDAPLIDGLSGLSAATANLAGNSISGFASVETKLDTLATLVQTVIGNMGRPIVLDTGVMVGQMAPAVDLALGAIFTEKEPL